jgi:sulfite exporter TauE/SafE
MWTQLIIGASIGLFGGFHCVAMCGPIVAFIHSKSQIKTTVIIYNFGRLITYVLLGVILGLVGDGFQIFGLQRWLSVISGITILAITLFPQISKMFSRIGFSFSPIQKMKMQLSKATKNGNSFSYLFLGMLNGLLPCGLVYVALAASLSTADTFSAATLMLGFGLGTWPLMSIVAFGSGWFAKTGKLRLNYIVPALTILVGVILIARGLALDIPYLSPVLAKLGPDFAITTCGNP